MDKGSPIKKEDFERIPKELTHSILDQAIASKPLQKMKLNGC